MKSITREYIEKTLQTKNVDEFKDLWQVDTNEERLQAIRDICEFMDKNGGKTPSTTAIDVEEKRFGRKLSNLKQVSKNCKWYKEYLVEAKNRGYPKLFEVVNRKEEGLQAIRHIFDFMDNNEGKSPNRRAVDLEESRLGIKLSNLKIAKKCKGKRGAWYDDYLVEAKKRGYPKLFEVRK